MAIKTSGALSLNEIHAEVGGTSESVVSLNDTDLRGLTPASGYSINSTSGTQISIGDFYGASSAAVYVGAAALSPTSHPNWDSSSEASPSIPGQNGDLVILVHGSGSGMSVYHNDGIRINDSSALNTVATYATSSTSAGTINWGVYWWIKASGQTNPYYAHYYDNYAGYGLSGGVMVFRNVTTLVGSATNYAGGLRTYNNPPSATASSTPKLWVAVGAHKTYSGSSASGATPSGYTKPITDRTNSSPYSTGTHMAYKIATNTTEDPGALTAYQNTYQYGRAATLAFA